MFRKFEQSMRWKIWWQNRGSDVLYHTYTLSLWNPCDSSKPIRSSTFCVPSPGPGAYCRCCWWAVKASHGAAWASQVSWLQDPSRSLENSQSTAGSHSRHGYCHMCSGPRVSKVQLCYLTNSACIASYMEEKTDFLVIMVVWLNMYPKLYIHLQISIWILFKYLFILNYTKLRISMKTTMWCLEKMCA